jgi:predicted DNA-binding transcriptional regulator AlpA
MVPSHQEKAGGDKPRLFYWAIVNQTAPGFNGMTTTLATKDLLTSEDLEAYLNFHQGWAAKARVRGDGPKFVKLGRAIRYRKPDVEAWLAEHVKNSTSECN